MDMNIEMDKNTATDSITSRLADARNDLGITQLSRPLTHQRLPPIPPDYPGWHCHAVLPLVYCLWCCKSEYICQILY